MGINYGHSRACATGVRPVLVTPTGSRAQGQEGGFLHGRVYQNTVTVVCRSRARRLRARRGPAPSGPAQSRGRGRGLPRTRTGSDSPTRRGNPATAPIPTPLLRPVERPTGRCAMTAVGTSLDHLHDTFRRWLSDGYDLAAIDATVATAAAGQFGGDPLWLMVIGGSGGAKTETVCALASVQAHMISTISSEAALLTASTPKKPTKEATGGVLREIHDGHWQRRVGFEGGRVLEWHGHLTIVAACTTAWDFAHAVVASMGDRFVILRMDTNSDAQRLQAAGQAWANLGREAEMRAELRDAVQHVVRSALPLNGFYLSGREADYLNQLAAFVTRCRTAVEGNYRGEPVQAHVSEAPGRLIKQLGQLLRGAISIGMPRTDAFALVRRCAFDSMPPLRLRLLKALAGQGQQTVSTLADWLNQVWTTTKNHLQALVLLGLVHIDIVDEGAYDGRTHRLYSLAEGIEPLLNGDWPS